MRLAQREVALAGLALLAGATSLAVTQQTRHHAPTTPQQEGSYTALARCIRRGTCGPVSRKR